MSISWADHLQAVIGERGHVTVLAQTDSTQDAARRLAARPGDAIVAMRQSAGRGRHGRIWHDPGGDGIAVTLVVPAGPPASLAIGAAVGVAEAAEHLIGRAAGIKWPNDIVVGGRKLAGILIEVAGDLALAGVGMNVGQRSWPAALRGRAVSLAQLGAVPDRLAALAAILSAVPAALARPIEATLPEYRRRDALTGVAAAFTSAGETVRGTVVSVDPRHGLEIQTAGGRRFLDAATTATLPDP